MLTDRQKLILKAIIEEYVNTAEPVGSTSLIDKPYLRFSSATIRAEMAYLEAEGYLDKTHTSSGRIPSDKGYRYYVECLLTRDFDVQNEFPLIDRIFADNEMAREKAIKEALNLLSELTNYTSVALGPDTKTSLVKRLDFIPLSKDEAIVLIVTSGGHVQNQMINIPKGMDIEELRKVVATLNDVLKDIPLSEVSKILSEEISRSKVKEFMQYQEQLINSFLNAFSKFANDNFYLSGMSNIFDQPEFHDITKVRKYIETLDKVSLLKLTGDSYGLNIKIGLENEIVSMEKCTIVSVPYRINEDEIGRIAVIGPTRMEYKRVIPLLEYIAKNMGKLYRK